MKFLFNICLYANVVWKQSSVKLDEKKKEKKKEKEEQKCFSQSKRWEEVKDGKKTFWDLICTAIRDLKRTDV